MHDPRPIPERIASLEHQLAEINRWLPYADHGAYGQDLKRIDQIHAELRSLKAAAA